MRAAITALTSPVTGTASGRGAAAAAAGRKWPPPPPVCAPGGGGGGGPVGTAAGYSGRGRRRSACQTPPPPPPPPPTAGVSGRRRHRRGQIRVTRAAPAGAGAGAAASRPDAILAQRICGCAFADGIQNGQIFGWRWWFRSWCYFISTCAEYLPGFNEDVRLTSQCTLGVMPRTKYIYLISFIHTYPMHFIRLIIIVLSSIIFIPIFHKKITWSVTLY